MGMNKSAMLRLAREMMDEYGLTEARGWELVTNRSRRNAGTAQLGRITLSVPILVEGDATEDDVRNTILHEIAHCLVGPGHGHDDVWRSKFISIGGNGRTTHSIKTSHRYRGTCRCTGKTFARDAKSNRMHHLICRRCGTLITWYDTVERTIVSRARTQQYAVAASAPKSQRTETVLNALCTKCFTIKAVNGTCNC